MCEFSEYGFEAEWGDYIRRHATAMVRGTDWDIGEAIASIKLSISRGVAPDDLGERIVAARKRRA
jgi:hypothetical protein